MATWITHLMIADGLLERFPTLHRTGFCVGNIAPDCNIENEDWTQFIPSREITHWMQGEQKNNLTENIFTTPILRTISAIINRDRNMHFCWDTMLIY